MYIANNDGLLEFDGNRWTCYPLPNKTIVRSVVCDTLTGRIYVGGQGEIGYFFPDTFGKLRFHSLLESMPEGTRLFDDVWDIIPLPPQVFFRTKDKVFRLSPLNQMDVFDLDGTLSFMGLKDNQIWVQRNTNELLLFRNDQFQLHFPSLPFSSEITSFLPYRNDTTLVTTLKNGIFFWKQEEIGKWETPLDNFLKENRIYCATSLGKDRLALGTTRKGLVVLHSDRTTHRILNKETKLQQNNVLFAFPDRNGDLWLGLDNGIDFIEITSPVSFIYPDETLEATGYAALIHNDHIYFGTSNGLYSAPWRHWYDPLRPRAFKSVEGASGQVWSLNAVGDDLLMGHHDGVFSIGPDHAVSLSSRQGAWLLVPLDDSLLLCGTYNGLALFRKGQKGWESMPPLTGLNESCRIMTLDKEGQIWISHPYRGVFRVQLDKARKDIKVYVYQTDKGLPSHLFNYVFQIKGKTLVAGETGIYQYNVATDRFDADSAFMALFEPGVRIKHLREDAQGNIWYAAGDEVGMLKVWDEGIEKRIEKQAFPALAGKLVGGFEHIYPYDSLHVFFGSEKGFILLNPSRQKAALTSQSDVVLREVRLLVPKDSLIFSGLFNDGTKVLSAQAENQIPRIPYKWNSLRFSFSATGFSEAPQQFRYFLEGFDKNWTAWQSKTEREFTNLPAGKYTFRIQHLGPSGLNGKELSYSFEIIPPWYASKLAISFYILAGMAMIWGLIFFQKRRFESEKAELTSEHQGMVNRTQQEINRLQHEKLETEIQFKNRELASATMHLVQKGKMILKIEEELSKLLRKYQATPQLRREIQELLSLVAGDNQLDEDWKQFAYHFDQVYIDFQRRLQEKYPQLSPNDHKLCAYLRMNLTSKEIASLMNISIRGVEASRYRLRKKLDLPTDANLTDFILKI